jgi:hypothetical protein
LIPAERREKIVELVSHGPATVAWLARQLRMGDQADLVTKDLQALRKSGEILLYHVRHTSFNVGTFQHWPPKIVLLVAVAVRKGPRRS